MGNLGHFYFLLLEYFATNSSNLLLWIYMNKVVSLIYKDIFLDLQWIPETTDNIEPYMCCFFYTYIPILKFKL